jgi:hypothetical protein
MLRKCWRGCPVIEGLLPRRLPQTQRIARDHSPHLVILLIKRSWRQAPCTLNRAFFGRLIKHNLPRITTSVKRQLARDSVKKKPLVVGHQSIFFIQDPNFL